MNFNPTKLGRTVQDRDFVYIGVPDLSDAERDGKAVKNGPGGLLVGLK